MLWDRLTPTTTTRKRELLEMNTAETLTVEQEHQIAIVTLNRPGALNAINAAMLEELQATFEQLASEPAVRVILLTGSGDRAFAAGADIRELQQTDALSGQAVSVSGQRVFHQIEHCGKPTVACLNGVAFGGGLELALACTFRLASEFVRVGLPEAKLGLIPGFGGLHRLVRQVGRSAALHMILTAQPVQADEAHRLGLIDQVVPGAELMRHARQMAATMAQLAPLAVSSVLSLVEQEETLSPRDGYRLEAERFGQLCGSADKREGLAAFLEKRPPQWTAS